MDNTIHMGDSSQCSELTKLERNMISKSFIRKIYRLLSMYSYVATFSCFNELTQCHTCLELCNP